MFYIGIAHNGCFSDTKLHKIQNGIPLFCLYNYKLTINFNLYFFFSNLNLSNKILVYLVETVEGKKSSIVIHKIQYVLSIG